jgi:hypothetical protein
MKARIVPYDSKFMVLEGGDPMEKKFPHGFDPTSSVLFLGAGFSFSAKNSIKSAPPAAAGLELAIKNVAGLPPSDNSSLSDLASYAADKGHNIFELLSNLYCITELSSEQQNILKQPWLRIYTTNYDDSVEFFWSTSGKERKSQSFSLEDQVPNQFRSGSVVHLHGYIHKCTQRSLMSQLVLSHYSYAQQRAVTSPWWEVFERDIRVAQNIFFLGYELNDFEPASYLTKNPALIDKTHFILRASKSPVTENRLQQYGTRHSIEISGFADECKAAVIRERPEHPNALSSFKYVDILKDNKTAAKPSAIEIQALFAFGKFNYQRLISTFPKSSYISVRGKTLSQSIDRIKNTKTLILHSKTGNGKTIFRHGLTVALSQNGYACFELRENLTPLQSDLEFLKRQEKAVIIFPDYDTAYANMHLFSEMRADVTFIIEMNTSTLQVRQSEVFKRISNPIERIDLNRLTREDCQEIHEILDEAGIAPRDFKIKFGSGSEFRDIVLSVFENPELVKKIDSLITPLMSDGNAKFVIMCSAILRVSGINTDPTFLRSISKVDPFQILTQIGESAYEFVDFSHDRVEPHSALFSEFLIKRYLQPHELSGAVFRMAAEAARRMNEEDSFQSTRARNARSTLGALLRFSFLDDVLRHHPERSQHMQDIYENGRRDEYI